MVIYNQFFSFFFRKDMKIKLFLFYICVSVLTLVAQTKPNKDWIIDLQVGTPNIQTALLRGQGNLRLGGIQFEKVSGFVPLAAMISYKFAPKISASIDANYSTNVVYFTDNANFNAIHHAFHIPRYRVLAALNFHFGKSEKMDYYARLGAGYIFLKPKLMGDSTASLAAQNYIFRLRNTYNVIGFGPSLRIAVGFRYFFAPFLGLNMEAGFGGPLLRMGVSLRFGKKK